MATMFCGNQRFRATQCFTKQSGPWERETAGGTLKKKMELSALPKTDIAPENRPSQKETSIPTIHFQALC